MERNFKNEDFEQFLKQSADGLRMRPSEKVWKGISGSLNKRRRRFGFILGVSLLATSTLGYFLIEPAVSATDNNIAKENSSSQTKNQSLSNTAKPSGPVTASLANAATGQLMPINTGMNRATAIMNSRADQKLVLLPAVIQDNNVNLFEQQKQNQFTSTIVDSYPGTQYTESVQKTETKKEATYPLTIESVTNTYSPKYKKGRLGLQLFFTPTVSYRGLRENKTYSGQLSGYDFNKAVHHKPDLGFQLGLMAKYPISPKVKLRGGIQFNVNRYDIRTNSSSYEVATIRFSNRQTVTQMTGYNNFNGYKSNWLQNLYLSVSAPLGAEVKLAGNKRTNFGIAGSLQPTYMLSDNAYLISTDYKNYMEVPWLIRKWNVSTGLETYVSYSTGNVKWQVGPQVRYQLLSSYEKKYPVKEHLFDFGLRVGISLNNR